jgi:hypothetical protein
MPRSSATSRRVRPLANANRTVLRRNSAVDRFAPSIEHLLVHQLVLSICPKQVQLETFMTTQSAQHVLLDRQIFKTLSHSQLVAGPHDFSRFLGCCPSYFSAAQTKRMPISVPALVKLATELQSRAKTERDPERVTVIKSVCNTLYSEI